MTMESASSDARCSGGGNLASTAGPSGGSEAAVVEADSVQAAASSPGNNSSPTPAENMQNDDMDADDEDDEDEPANEASSNGITPAPTSREMRNRAEKQRRDKLNTYIQELSQINPLISSSERKMDKTSVLRLSAALMRLKKCREALEETMELDAAPNVQASATSFDNNNSICSADTVGNKDDVASSSLTVAPYHSKRNSNNWFPFPENFTEHMLEDINSFLLIVAGNSKIIYVSSSVVKLLGHSQNELMGTLLSDITCTTDKDSLRRGLQITPDSEFGSNTNIRCQRKNFFIKLKQKAAGRTDSSQYEIFQIIGNLKVLGGSNNLSSAGEAHSTQICRKSTARIRESGSNQNQNQPDVVLMAIAKQASLQALVNIDACKEEYVTRHSLDGDIIFVDQRVSFTCGYMVDELCGLSAFRYVHFDDLHWLLVSLRQMFTKNGRGNSTYRLQAKTGEFVYMQSHGVLEFDKETNKIISFVCTNTLLTPEEGKKGIEEMRKRFNAKIKNSDFNLKIAAEDKDKLSAMVDPSELTQIVSKHLRDITLPQLPISEEVPEPEYRKCIVASKSLPPPATSMKILNNRRSSTASGSPMHSQTPPASPVSSKEFAKPRVPQMEAVSFGVASEPTHQLDAIFLTGKTTCVGRPRAQRQQRAASQELPAKQSRRGRPRGSGVGTKRKAVKCEADTPTAKRNFPVTFPCEEQPFKVLHASMVEDSLSINLWDDGTNTIMEEMSTLCDDSQELGLFDNLHHLQLSPSQSSLQVQSVAKTALSDSIEDVASVCGTIHELENSIDRQPDIGI